MRVKPDSSCDFVLIEGEGELMALGDFRGLAPADYRRVVARPKDYTFDVTSRTLKIKAQGVSSDMIPTQPTTAQPIARNWQGIPVKEQ